jgi:hypothetical protein
MYFSKMSIRGNGIQQNGTSVKHPFGEIASAKWVSVKWTSAKSPDT